jgi:tetratricopeptide (TPR) repeat protein
VARGTQHRKRRPSTNARLAPAAARAHSRPKRAAWEDDLFFGRLRTHARWVFVLIAVAFIVSFVLLGVGSGSSGISQLLGNLLSGTTASGSSLSALQKQTVQHPASATDWLNYANKLEEDHDDDLAITALNRYIDLRPKDQNALLELAGLNLSRATDWENLYSNEQALDEALDPSNPVSPVSSSALGKALGSLPDQIPTAINSSLSTVTNNAYEQVLTYLNNRVTVYQKLVALTPGNAVNEYSLAQAAQAANSNKVALKAYEAFVKLAPNDSLAPTARSEIKTLKASVG